MLYPESLELFSLSLPPFLVSRAHAFKCRHITQSTMQHTVCHSTYKGIFSNCQKVIASQLCFSGMSLAKGTAVLPSWLLSQKRTGYCRGNGHERVEKPSAMCPNRRDPPYEEGGAARLPMHFHLWNIAGLGWAGLPAALMLLGFLGESWKWKSVQLSNALAHSCVESLLVQF